MLYAGSDLDKAREVFAAAIYHRPRIQLTIRQRSHVLEQWPASAQQPRDVEHLSAAPPAALSMQKQVSVKLP
jgi:hypothetical protein